MATVSLNISPYQWVEKPEKIYVLDVELSEKSIITAIGAYKKMNMSTI